MSAEALKRAWLARTPRERAFLATAALTVALAALYALLWQPGITAVRSLGTQLPRLHGQIEEMHALRKEISALRDGSAASAQPRTPAVLQAALDADPAAKAAIRSQWRGANQLSMEAEAIDFDQWIALVSRLQRELGARVERCSVSALPQRPGMVKMEAVLALPAATRR